MLVNNTYQHVNNKYTDIESDDFIIINGSV